jgi:ADP-ribosylation factor GTPase-activating protein 1
MADQLAAKRILQDLVKRDDLKNKLCNDCPNPNPQWASLSFAVFLCLQCAGIHRGFGVHVSFVRSVSMDAWQDEQIKRMQLGGNAPFQEFVKSYAPAEQGGYKAGMSAHDKYHCWAATQYREKLDATLAGRDWAPSPPTASDPIRSRSGSPVPSQGLRKARTSSRNPSNRSGSPGIGGSPNRTPDLSADPKARNETYFASLGRENANRPLDLPPSQGGRYTGFGSTPPPSQDPPFALSSANAPTLNDLQENPKAALTKSWSLLSAAVLGASRAVSENIIQPGMEKVSDPNFQATMKGYMTEAQKKASSVGSAANEWSRSQLGVDVAGSVGGVVDTVKDRLGAGPQRDGYNTLSMRHDRDGETTSLYYDHDDEEDFFGEYHQGRTAVPTSASTATPTTANTKGTSEWDEWKDF